MPASYSKTHGWPPSTDSDMSLIITGWPLLLAHLRAVDLEKAIVAIVWNGQRKARLDGFDRDLLQVVFRAHAPTLGQVVTGSDAATCLSEYSAEYSIFIRLRARSRSPQHFTGTTRPAPRRGHRGGTTALRPARIAPRAVLAVSTTSAAAQPTRLPMATD